MAKRYFVCRAYLKYKGVLYTKGDLLPETFNHHDKARSIYGSRVGVCEVEDFVEDSVKVPSPITTPLTGGVKTPDEVKSSETGEEEVTVPESAGTETPEGEGDGSADEVTETPPTEVPPETPVDEVPETGSSSAAEPSKFNFNLPTGTPT